MAVFHRSIPKCVPKWHDSVNSSHVLVLCQEAGGREGVGASKDEGGEGGGGNENKEAYSHKADEPEQAEEAHVVQQQEQQRWGAGFEEDQHHKLQAKTQYSDLNSYLRGHCSYI